jgi:tetratricopeptide (TPR) repeat protein
LTGRGLTIVSVNFDAGEQRDLAREFASQRRFSFPILLGSDEVAAVYNILYRYIFDRHRDLSLPTSFLLDPKGEIVRIYQGPVNAESLQRDFQQVPSNRAERIAKALPFSGNSNFDFSRNYLSLGSVFFQRGYYDEAGEFFTDALRDDPSSAEALYGIGSVKLRQDKFAEAKQSFQGATRARASYPDTLPNAWNNLGIISTREHRMSDAVQQFQRAIEINPGYVVARVNLGNAYRELKQWDNARASLEEAVRLAASDAEANYSLGMVYAQTEDSERAEQYLIKALQARPDYPEALNNVGILLLRTQRRDEAVARFEESIRVAPAFDQAYLNLARVYAMEGDREKARKTLLDLMKHKPEHPVAKQMLQQLQ